MAFARNALLPVVAVGLAALAGCGEPTIVGTNLPLQPVKGKITLNGQPLTHGLLKLVLTTNHDKFGEAEAVAEVKPDGTFEPRQANDKPGLVPGTWKAYVSPTFVKDGKTVRMGVPAKYTKEGTSDLTFEVREGENTPALAIK
jgi:hypothetical protein